MVTTGDYSSKEERDLLRKNKIKISKDTILDAVADIHVKRRMTDEEAVHVEYVENLLDEYKEFND